MIKINQFNLTINLVILSPDCITKMASYSDYKQCLIDQSEKSEKLNCITFKLCDKIFHRTKFMLE